MALKKRGSFFSFHQRSSLKAEKANDLGRIGFTPFDFSAFYDLFIYIPAYSKRQNSLTSTIMML
jgi:hypothetical protein|tara:strand:+ start:1616 stop:1807 length:192 start_codon:yes stop_codon:yes gene_type:complete